jgi:hypothetical protein
MGAYLYPHKPFISCIPALARFAWLLPDLITRRYSPLGFYIAFIAAENLWVTPARIYLIFEKRLAGVRRVD